jgi:hypothetical protein
MAAILAARVADLVETGVLVVIAGATTEVPADMTGAAGVTGVGMTGVAVVIAEAMTGVPAATGEGMTGVRVVIAGVMTVVLVATGEVMTVVRETGNRMIRVNQPLFSIIPKHLRFYSVLKDFAGLAPAVNCDLGESL